MADLFGRLADRARGEAGTLAPRMPTRFEPPALEHTEPEYTEPVLEHTKPATQTPPMAAAHTPSPGVTAAPAAATVASATRRDAHARPPAVPARPEPVVAPAAAPAKPQPVAPAAATAPVSTQIEVVRVAAGPEVTVRLQTLTPHTGKTVAPQVGRIVPAMPVVPPPPPVPSKKDTVVHISIGRIEVRGAATQPSVPVREPARDERQERLSLSDYLRGGDRGPK